MGDTPEHKILTNGVPSWGKKRGQVMEKVENHLSGEIIAIRYDKKEKNFYFEDGDLYYICKISEPLVPKAHDLMKDRLNINFIPVIMMKQTDTGNRDEGGEAGINLSYERLYIGFHKEAELVRSLTWDEYHRKKIRMPFEDGPHVPYTEEELQKMRINNSSNLWDVEAMPALPYLVPDEWVISRHGYLFVTYDDGLWDKLQDFELAIFAIQDRMNALFTPEGLPEFLSIGLPQLPAGPLG